MKIESIHGDASGRSCDPRTAADRLVAAVERTGSFAYIHYSAGDGLHWGTLTGSGLDLPAMGKGPTPDACRAATYGEALERISLSHAAEGLPPGAEDAGVIRIRDLLPHLASLDATLLDELETTRWPKPREAALRLPDGPSVRMPLRFIHAISGTNGLAAGMSHTEAILQGLMEVIERRALITWIRNRLLIPNLDPAVFSDPLIRQQLAALRDHNLDILLKDLSFDGALPCVAVVCTDRGQPDRFQSHTIVKAAAAFDPATALRSCLTELAQTLRLGEAVRDPDAPHRRLLAEIQTDNFLPLFWFGYVPWLDRSFLQSGSKAAKEPLVARHDLRESVLHTLEIFSSLGLTGYAIDLTHPVAAIPVAQVVVPGYSDVLPYHPRNSPVLRTGWTRSLPMGFYEDGTERRPFSAETMFGPHAT